MSWLAVVRSWRPTSHHRAPRCPPGDGVLTSGPATATAQLGVIKNTSGPPRAVADPRITTPICDAGSLGGACTGGAGNYRVSFTVEAFCPV